MNHSMHANAQFIGKDGTCTIDVWSKIGAIDF